MDLKHNKKRSLLYYTKMLLVLLFISLIFTYVVDLFFFPSSLSPKALELGNADSFEFSADNEKIKETRSCILQLMNVVEDDSTDIPKLLIESLQKRKFDSIINRFHNIAFPIDKDVKYYADFKTFNNISRKIKCFLLDKVYKSKDDISRMYQLYFEDKQYGTLEIEEMKNELRKVFSQSSVVVKSDKELIDFIGKQKLYSHVSELVFNYVPSNRYPEEIKNLEYQYKFTLRELSFNDSASPVFVEGSIPRQVTNINIKKTKNFLIFNNIPIHQIEELQIDSKEQFKEVESLADKLNVRHLIFDLKNVVSYSFLKKMAQLSQLTIRNAEFGTEKNFFNRNLSHLKLKNIKKIEVRDMNDKSAHFIVEYDNNSTDPSDKSIN